jgi:hypothetical protein
MAFLYLILLMLGFPDLYAIREIIKEKNAKRKQLRLAKVYDKLVIEHKFTIEHIGIFETR